MSFLHLADKIRLRFGRYKVGTPTANSQPGAHTGTSRQYIPGYSDSNIIYLDTAAGNDGNAGTSEGAPKLTYASAATAAGSTKKIRVINDGATLSTNITKPTEVKRGISASISADYATAWNTWTSAGTPSFGADNVNDVIYSRVAARFIAVGNTGKLAYSTNGNVWTQAATPSFGGSNVQAVSENTSIIVAVGNSGKIATSIDGDTWTQRTSPTTATLTWVSFNSALGLFAACGSDSVIVLSADGITWRVAASLPNAGAVGSTVWSIESNPEGRFIAVADSSKIFYSDDGENWFPVGETPGGSFSSVTYNTLRKEFLAASGGSATWYRSSDGLTWEAFAPGFGVSQCRYVKDLGIYVGLGSGVYKISWSSTGDSWTSAATPVIIASRSFAVSPSLLGVVVGDSAGIVYKQVTMPDISADIAGFSISGATYTGTRTLYNCTLGCPTTTAPVNLNACRVREAGASFSNNTQAHFGTLFEGDAFFTSAPASQNAFALNCNTFAGSMYVYNSSATNYEQIRDNVIVGDFTASFAAPMLSGNLQGTNTNGILAKAVTLSDPAFVNTTDYKLKRLTNGDSQDSPLCNAAVYYVNEQGEPRDMGAWSEDDSENPVDYRYSYFIDKPAGNGIRPQKIVAASADQGMDGTWDSVNEPERASEYLTITYSAAVSREHVVIQDLLESLIDMTCEVSLTPDLSDPETAVTVNGNHSIGDIVLNIDASSTIKAGMVLPIGGVNYFILYTASGSSPTKLVLHKPLESAVSDNTGITPQEPTTYGTFQYIPQSREIPRPTKMETDYVNGVSFKFVRQYPQV